MLVTVFTPTYNRQKQLKGLYDSLCSQTFQDFEWLIVDDGSEDNTADVVKKWIEEEKINIRYPLFLISYAVALQLSKQNML